MQSINFEKTLATWSTKAIDYPNPILVLKCRDYIVKCTKKHKYLGYWITNKLGWSLPIDKAAMKIRQSAALAALIRFAGLSSWPAHHTLFTLLISLLLLVFHCRSALHSSTINRTLNEVLGLPEKSNLNLKKARLQYLPKRLALVCRDMFALQDLHHSRRFTRGLHGLAHL